MKKLVIATIVFGLAVGCAWAKPLNPIRTFEWTQDKETFEVLDHWELRVWNEEISKYETILIIPKPAGGAAINDTYSGRYTLSLGNFPVWSTVTKDFVLVAVSAEGKESEPSNVVVEDFEVESGKPNLNKISE